MINFSTAKPPANLYNRCRERFGNNVDWDKGVIFTYGDTVYSKNEIREDLKVHESTHIKQQAEIGKDAWWDKYFINDSFRLSQEVEAYRNQIKYINTNYNRKLRKHLYNHIIWSMVNLYGFNCTEKEAEKLLK